MPRKCEQCHDAWATVYAIDPIPGGWGGYYCRPCVKRLGFKIIETLKEWRKRVTTEESS